ncbi:MAG: hypothetical protein LLG13_08170 [Bacteroidales bacterium]|nr:hypothetical protein [Bacteroidales bacterium]
MEDIYTFQSSRVESDRKLRTTFLERKISPERNLADPVIDNLIAEGGENFFHYLGWLGLVNDPAMLVLSSRHHYYYDCNDLRGVKTLINLKKLNLIRHLDSFIHTLNNVVSPKTNFIGCFYDRGTQRRASLSERIHKKFINFFDSRIFIEIGKKDVIRLMESNGFKVIDMTEINGVTYFRTQNN